MQKVIEFKKTNFWSSTVDIKLLNEKIASLNQDGWVVKSITSNMSVFGSMISYTLLLELNE
ncbi:hypothetical protein BI198_03220 [Rheinheimera salexigens]|uniref:DUF4177 domain-containing protein n=1 Tax=Rheinheimera salexigens TaxID=1628148 RepID=A0A1E7Q3R4_9GAMM|nr:hypothetical protein BI198_03220 [Rheinheimera salexigens]